MSAVSAEPACDFVSACPPVTLSLKKKKPLAEASYDPMSPLPAISNKPNLSNNRGSFGPWLKNIDSPVYSCSFPKSLGSVASYVPFLSPSSSLPVALLLLHLFPLRCWPLISLSVGNIDTNSQICLPSPDFSPKLHLFHIQINTGTTNPKLSICPLKQLSPPVGIL